jgi:hypothetical protein
MVACRSGHGAPVPGGSPSAAREQLAMICALTHVPRRLARDREAGPAIVCPTCHSGLVPEYAALAFPLDGVTCDLRQRVRLAVHVTPASGAVPGGRCYPFSVTV